MPPCPCILSCLAPHPYGVHGDTSPYVYRLCPHGSGQLTGSVTSPYRPQTSCILSDMEVACKRESVLTNVFELCIEEN